MIMTTREQRVALARVYSRQHPLPEHPLNQRKWLEGYRAFRKAVRPSFDRSGCIMVHWAGMWLGIETDGYTHS